MHEGFYESVRQAFLTELAKCWHEAAYADPLLVRLKRVTYEHGTSTQMADVHGIVRETEMERLGAKFTMNEVALLKGDAQVFRETMSAGAATLCQQVKAQFYRVMERATDEVGNVRDLGGAPLSGRALCDMVERMDLTFDKDGYPKMPTLVIHPDLREHVRQLLELPEVQLRLDAILREKWIQRYLLK